MFLVQVLVGGIERIVQCRSVAPDPTNPTRMVLSDLATEVELLHDGNAHRVRTWAIPQAFVGWYAEVDPPQT